MRSWLRPALALVIAVTVLRWGLLAFDRTDLFVDEAQYWLWAQSPDFGYYSKPPLVAWVIGAVTALLGDSPFAIRMAGAGLHGTTALILGAVAARRIGAEAAPWAVAAWLVAPFVAVGSLMISTDTVMLPCLALALWAHGRIAQGGIRWALASGAALGLACLGKYAALYGLVALLLAGGTRWRDRAALLGAFLVVVSPNLLWNLQHHFATISHTGDNIGWVKGKVAAGGLGEAAAFLGAQFAVFGPVAFAGFLLAARRGPRDLVLWAALPLVLVTGQAFMAKAYANWALAAWVPGAVLASGVLARHVRWARVGLGAQAVFALALPLLTLAPQVGPEGHPLLARYIGRADLSRQILAASEGLPIVSANRDILADLFYTGRESGAAVFAFPYLGPPRSYYEQVHALPRGTAGEVYYIGPLPRPCPVKRQQTLIGTGVWAGASLPMARIEAACLWP